MELFVELQVAKAFLKGNYSANEFWEFEISIQRNICGLFTIFFHFLSQRFLIKNQKSFMSLL